MHVFHFKETWFSYEIHVLFVLIYTYCFPAPFPYHMTFVSFNSNSAGITSGAGITYSSGAPALLYSGG